MERPAGIAAYRAWRVFGRQLLSKAAVEQAMRLCKEWILDDEDKRKPRPEPAMPTVRLILEGPKPAGAGHVLSDSCAASTVRDVLPGPLPPPGSLVQVFPSPLQKPVIADDDFKTPSLPPVLPCPSAPVPPVPPPPADDDFKTPSLPPVLPCPSAPVPPPPADDDYARRWSAAGFALLAGALYFAHTRAGRLTPPTPDARSLDVPEAEPATAGATEPDARSLDVPEAEPATAGATEPDATEPDPIDEDTRGRARFFMFVLLFATLCFPADFACTATE